MVYGCWWISVDSYLRADAYPQIAAVTGYPKSNIRASDLWERVYPIDGPGVLHIALTDTFSSKPFFDDFFLSEDGRRKQFPQRWKGLRQDSGDPIAFARQAKEAYDNVGVDVTEKTIVFSDSLDIEKSLEINKVAKELGFEGERSSFSLLWPMLTSPETSELWNRDVLDKRFQGQGHRKKK